MNAIIEFHHAWAWVVVFSNALVGLWSLAAHWFAPPRRKTLWFAVGAAEVAVFVQVVLGVTMVAGGRTEPAPMHMFYGFVSVISIAVLFAYRHSLRAHMYQLYGFGSLFVMGLGIRALLLT